MGAIYSTKITGNFGLKLNGSVRSNRKSFEKIGPPFEVDHFSRFDWSDQNGPFHLTIPGGGNVAEWLEARFFNPLVPGSNTVLTASWCCSQKPRVRLLGCACSFYGFLRVNLSCYPYRSEAAFQAKCVFWLLTHTANIWERSAQNNPF